MKKVAILVLVLFSATMIARADVVSDYMVKVLDATPSYPVASTPMARYGVPIGTSTWGSSGGNLQLYFNDSGTWIPQTAICTYSPGGTLSVGAASTPQIAGYGNHFSTLHPYNDYSTGNQLVRTWEMTVLSDSNNPGWSGRLTNVFYSVAMEATGVTFTTPIRVTIVNTSMMHINPVGNSRGWTHPQTMLNGGYLTKDRCDMGDTEGFMTSLTTLPAHMWENIDESMDVASAWSGFGQPDDDWYNWGEGGLLRLCDNTLAANSLATTPWQAGGGGCGHGLWINTVSDSLPGNTPVWDGWRNDGNNSTTRSIDIMLIGPTGYASVAGVSTTRTMMRPAQTLAIAPRHKDTATKFLATYASVWPSKGLGYYELQITGQKGDLNFDGKCDFSDLPLFSATFNKSLGDTGYNGDADLNGDNKVDFSDLPGFSGVFGSSCQ
jgi:hypothetical protein